MTRALLCAALALLSRGEPAVQREPAARGDSAVEREWGVRRRALAPREHAAELRAGLAAAAWTERAAAWEALLRADRVDPLALDAATEGRPWARAVAAGIADDHPNVRARALELLAERPAWLELDAAAAARLAADPLPAVRAALARALARQSGSVAVERLAELANDPDPRVAGPARRGLFLQERSAEPAKFAALADVDPARKRDAFAERLTELATGEPTGTLLRALGERVAGDPGLGALIAALGARSDPGGDDADARRLARGWLDVGTLPPGARSLAREAAARLGPRAGRALVERAREVEGEPAWRTLFEGALDAVSPDEFLALVDGAELPAEAERVAWKTLAGRSPEWAASWTGARLAPWLAPDRDPRLRAAVADAVLDAFRQEGTARTGALVADLLDDPLAADDAFEALCVARDPRPWLDELHRAWARLPAGERVDRLRRLPRDVALSPFRADLLRLGEQRRDLRGVLAELLAPFALARRSDATAAEGDAAAAAAAVRAALLAWLETELGALGLTVSSATPAWRESELRATGLVRALAFFDPPRTAPLLRAAVLGHGDASVELGKLGAWALGQTAAGRAELRDVLHSDLPRRVRVEAASWRARDGDPDAVALLALAYPACELELKDRILRELGRLADGDSARFLEAVASDPAAVSGLRVAAAASLERRGLADALARALATAADVDARVALVESLGRAGDRERARAELLPELVALEAGAGSRLAAAGAPPEVRAAVREAVLIALAAARCAAPELREAWLRLPLARSAADLAARFGARRLASTTFSHRAELAVAEHLAEAGLLGAALDGAGPWWRADGRFLLELATRAAVAGDERSAERLAGGALAAFLGEPPDETRAELAFRAELQLLVLEERRGAWEPFARRAERLLRDHRAGRVPRRAWRGALGEVDRRAGVEPEARLESAALQARALAALEQGARDEAGRLARAAELRVGFSRAAREAQERLAARLRGEEPPPRSLDAGGDE